MADSRFEAITLLIVDDEELVLQVTAMMLEDLGSQIKLAKSGIEAIECLKQNPGKISLALIDFSMPELNGYETFLALRQIQPDLPVVMASGLGCIPEVEELRRKGEIEFLPKPYSEEQLVRIIERVALKS